MNFFSAHMEYDEAGNLLRVYNYSTDIVSFKYDQWDRAFETHYPDGTSEDVAYDFHDLPRTRHDRRGQTIGYDYDDFNRLTRVDYSDGPSFEEFEYDYVNGIKEWNNNGKTLWSTTMTISDEPG